MDKQTVNSPEWSVSINQYATIVVIFIYFVFKLSCVVFDLGTNVIWVVKLTSTEWIND